MVRKFKFNFFGKCGYLQVDIGFALIVFLMIFFLFLQISEDYYEKERFYGEEVYLKATAKDLCKLLVSTSGVPNNWENDISNFKVIGLKNENSFELDSQKLALMTNDNFDLFLTNMGLSNLVKVEILGLESENLYVNFGNEDFYQGNFGHYVCYSFYQGEVVEVEVKVWS